MYAPLTSLILYPILFSPSQEALSSSQQSNSADRSVLLSLETEKADIRAIAHTVRSNVKTLRGVCWHNSIPQYFELPSRHLCMCAASNYHYLVFSLRLSLFLSLSLPRTTTLHSWPLSPLFTPFLMIYPLSMQESCLSHPTVATVYPARLEPAHPPHNTTRANSQHRYRASLGK